MVRGGIMRAVLLAGLSLQQSVYAEDRPGDRHVTIAFGAEPTQVDPMRSSAGVDAYFIDLFYEGLTTVQPDLKRVNWLAESWELGEEAGKTFIDVKIREGVRFHNGETLTAHDYRYAYEVMRDPSNRASGQLRYIEAVTVLSDYRFRMIFSQPDASVIPLDLILPAVPRGYFEDVGVDGVQKHPIGTGPWKFVSRKLREELVVERNDDYWNKDFMPGIKRLTIKIIPEDTTRVAAFKTGAVDWIDAVPPAQIESFKAMPGVRVQSMAAPNNLFLSMQIINRRSATSDLRVRKAIAHAIDFEAIIQYILYGQGIRTAQIAPGGVGYDPDLAPYPYDPDRARELLREAGYERGVNLPCYNLTTPREPYIKEMGEAMFAYLGAVGIRCRIVQLEYGAWINLIRVNARPDMDGIVNGMWGQGLPGDPTDAWSGHLHSPGDGWGTYSYYSDPKMDGLIKQLRATMPAAEHEALARKIARLKHEQVAGGLPSYRPMIALAWRDTLEFTPHPGAFWRSMRGVRMMESAR
jgi:peptide/nickel transport system substrate-binding protein